MHFDSQQGPWTHVTPTVSGQHVARRAGVVSDQPAPVGGTSSVNYMGTL